MTPNHNIHSSAVVDETSSKSRAAKRDLAVSVEIVRDDVRFALLREQWNSMVKSSSASVYQTHEWLSLWWKHFRTPDCSLCVFLVRRGSTIEAIAPMYLYSQRWWGFRVCRQLKLMGGSVPLRTYRGLYAEEGPSDYLDIIIAKRDDWDILQTLTQSIQDSRHLYDEIEFTNVPEHSALVTTIMPALEAGGYRSSMRRASPCPYLKMPASVDDYLQELPSSVRRKFHHARKRQRQEQGYSIESILQQRDLLSAFRDLVALHQLRWNGAGYVGLFRDERFEHFQTDLVQLFFERGWLWFKTTTMGGTRFAARLAFRFNGRYYDYLSGFDDRFPLAKARPGYALLLSLIEDAISERYQVIDLLRGAESYKFDLTSTVAYNWNFRAVTEEYDGTVSYRLSRFLLRIENILHRSARELYILAIHFRRQGVLEFIPAYLRFFLKRMLGKANGIIEKQKSSTKEDTATNAVIGEQPARTPTKERNVEVGQDVQSVVQSFPSGEKPEERPENRLESQPESRKEQQESNFQNVRAQWLAKIYLRECTRVGERATTRARPFIDNAGSIVVGKGFRLDSHISKSALIAGKGGILEIGDEVTIGSGSILKSLNSVRIGNRVRIGLYALINDSADQSAVAGAEGMTPEPIVIEDDVVLGDRVTIIKGVVVGKGSYILPGSIVLGNIPPDVVAGGVPARVLARNTPRVREQPQSEATKQR